jgi:hypothetical protein
MIPVRTHQLMSTKKQLKLDATYAVNDPDVIADSIQGETLIINLINGVYYSSDGVGDEIWRCLHDGETPAQIVEAISAHYDGDGPSVREDVLAFISELLDDDLIVECGSSSNRSVTTSTNGRRPKFEKPVLQRYTDYQELLLLDPIHEVLESAGWPVPKSETGP